MKRLRGVLSAVGLLYILVTVTPLDRWWINALCGPIGQPKGDVLILLGGDAVADVIGYESYWRAVYGVRAWRGDGFRQIFISGASAAGPMRDFMTAEGVPGSAIRIETASRSTHENAVFTARGLAGTTGKTVLFTSDYHSFRACRAFRKAGMDVECKSFPDLYKQVSSWQYRWGIFLSLALESVKIGWYAVRGWI